MAHAPGFLDDLEPAGLADWNDYLERNIEELVESLIADPQFGRAPAIVPDGSPGLGGIAGVDWSGEPSRALQALPAEAPQDLGRFFDWTGPEGALGRSYVQEEYLEWRAVFEGGSLARVELTCETPDYWAMMASRNPGRAIELAAEFSGEAPEDVDVEALFGMDPAAASGPEELRRRWREHNGSDFGAPAAGPYNNGTRSILHMAQPPNAAFAAIQLALFAAYPRSVVENGVERALTGPEAIGSTPQSAVSCRNSDPTIVGVLVGAAFQGLEVALVDPFGIYMPPFNRDAITLDGEPLPLDWLSYGRGAGPDNPTGLQLYQRLTVAPPPGSGRSMGELLDSNGDPVVNGHQLAREQHVQILYRARNGAGAATMPIVGRPSRNVCGPAGSYAGDFLLAYRRFREAEGGRRAPPTRRD